MRAEQLIELGRKRLLKNTDRFSRVGDERLQAEELLEFAVGGPLNGEVSAGAQRKYEALLERRASGEPVAYIRGFEEFLGLRMTVGPGAFIPRQSTEYLAEQTIACIRRRKKPLVADLATGIGAVALAIGDARPDATVYATDISTKAMGFGKRNAKTLGISNVTFLKGSMYDPLPKALRGKFDAIASHPPYIATHELEGLPAELIDHEPIDTLTDNSDDGLGLVRVLIAGDWLKPGGWMCIEVARDLARPVRTMLTRGGYSEVRSTHGIHADTRVLRARR